MLLQRIDNKALTHTQKPQCKIAVILSAQTIRMFKGNETTYTRKIQKKNEH